MVEEGLRVDRAEIEAAERMRVPEPTGEVHPVAALFPMMTDDELDDLAADIRANGLLQPIVLDESGVVIDGRNRLAGCKRANIRPRFMLLNGHEPVAFILASNIARRHLTKGQQAMAVARSLRLNRKTQTEGASAIRVSQDYVSRANVVIDSAPDLADAVLSGATALNDAYEEARRRKTESESREVQLSRLQKEAPDLAALVQEERLSLAEARAAQEKRQKEERDHVAAVSKMLHTGLEYLDPREWDAEEHARGWLKADPSRFGEGADFSAARARRVAGALLRYAELKENEDE